jgi:probable rRNA maturation factor
MEILIDSRQTKLEIDQDDLSRKTERILERLGRSSDTTISISIVEAESMAELNRTYRGKEGPTNVLSFSQAEGEGGAFQPALLGDVVICADRVVSDAEELGYTRDEMLLYVLIHGVLHLVGYAHDTPPDAEAMAAEVEDIFREFYSEGATE